MASVKGTRTEKNLLASFAGESQAHSRYSFFASQAKKDGYVEIADFFTQTADQEKMHAKRFFSFLEGGPLEITATYPAGIIGTTEENLKAAFDGETEEYTVLYPEAAKIAEEEGFPAIAALFRNVAVAEKEHARVYEEFLKRVQADKVFKSEEEIVWKCRKCGFLFKGKTPPAKCPACLHPMDYFQPFTDAPLGLL